jgi:hypothetical protein
MYNFSRAFPKNKFTSIGVPSEKLCPFLGGPFELDFAGGWIRIGCELGGETNVETMAAEKGNTTETKHELNQQQRDELGQKLNTTDSEIELCKWLNRV